MQETFSYTNKHISIDYDLVA